MIDKVEATEIYEEGMQAFLKKLTLKDCPYSTNDERRSFWVGGFHVEKGKTECHHKKENTNKNKK